MTVRTPRWFDIDGFSKWYRTHAYICAPPLATYFHDTISVVLAIVVVVDFCGHHVCSQGQAHVS